MISVEMIVMSKTDRIASLASQWPTDRIHSAAILRRVGEGAAAARAAERICSSSSLDIVSGVGIITTKVANTD
jgi:hypothetical protein